MPLPAIGAGVAALGSAAIGAISQGSQNRRSQRWSERMYQRQYNDNVNFWRMQNEYNDPSQQMSRLEKAGLNPALVYGGSSGGSAGTAGPVQKAETPTPQFSPVLGQNVDLLGKYYNYEIQEAQADNLKAQNQAIKAKTALDLATAIFTGTRTARNSTELQQIKEIFPYQLDALKSGIAKTEMDIQFTRDENIRKQIRQGADLEQIGENILTMRLGRENTRKLMRSTDLGNRLKQLDINLRESGVQPNDNMLMRMLMQAIKSVDIPEWMNSSLFFGNGKGNY